MALRANKYTSVEAIRGDMGWSTLSERNMKGNTMYKLRVKRMGNDRWVKTVYMRLEKSQWAKSCKILVKKCGLNCREEGERGWWNVVCMNGEGYN